VFNGSPPVLGIPNYTSANTCAGETNPETATGACWQRLQGIDWAALGQFRRGVLSTATAPTVSPPSSTRSIGTALGHLGVLEVQDGEKTRLRVSFSYYAGPGVAAAPGKGA